ncbi:hypothetical protein WMY93_023741 [Mugilogobius chulae]|uniref:PX domain-containing protein n=1 Tax=Mugilogobius chulae TaxID=88201 RepID=A0AAW0N528_9GOBI
MATSSERSPPPFPDSEDQDILLDTEEIQQQERDSDYGEEDDEGDEMFMSTISDPPDTDTTPAATSQNTDPSLESPIDLNDPLIDPISDPSDSKPAAEVLSEPSDEFEDLSNTDDGDTKEIVEVKEPEAPAEETIKVTENTEIELEKDASSPLVNVTLDLLATETEPEKLADPLLDLQSDAAPTIKPKTEETSPLLDLQSNPTVQPKKQNVVDLFADDDEEEGSDLFADPRLSKPSKQQQKSLFEEVDNDDLFPEPLGATAKKPATISAAASVLEPKSIVTKAEVEVRSKKGAALMEPEDLFTEEAIETAPKMPSGAVSKTNGLHEEDSDIFADATVELSLDSPRNERKRELEEEEEEDDKFEIQISVKEPEKIGDGMNAYMAYKVFTQTTLAMFRSPTFSVRRRYSDFLGLYEKLSEKHGPNGYIVPPPRRKTCWVSSSSQWERRLIVCDFLERRRGALESKYLQRVVSHPTLLQDPDVREFLEREEGSFDHRMKAWQRWQDAQSMLQKKREAEAKLLWANKPDKLQLAKEEIAEWEAKVTQYERDFERVSATVRKEVLHFEKERTKNFKKQIMKYLESMLRSQQQLIKYWEAFLPEAKAIA